MSSIRLRDRAYMALRDELRAGIRAPGAAISLKDAVDDLGLGSTPIREALNRLQGEGMVVEALDRTGFAVARPGARGVAELMLVHAALARTAVLGGVLPATSAAEIGPAVIGDIPSRTEHVFRPLWRAAGGETLITIAGHLADRLAPYRHAESIVFSVDDEIGDLENTLRGPRKQALRALQDFHRRRVAAASTIVEACEDGVAERRREYIRNRSQK